MKLYLYRGLLNEKIPHPRNDYTHVVIDRDVKVIQKGAFEHCDNLVSVVMYDNVVTIEDYAFYACSNLEMIKLSKTLNYIGKGAFMKCSNMKSYCIPSTVAVIERNAFGENRKLRFIIVPRMHQDQELPDLTETSLYSATAKRFGIRMNEEEEREMKRSFRQNRSILLSFFRAERDRLKALHKLRVNSVNPWLHDHMREYPFHVMCFTPSISVRQMNEYIGEEDTSVAMQIDKFHRMSPLHFLSMNPHAPIVTFENLFERYKNAIFKKDFLRNTPLEYAALYNFDGMLAMIRCLCVHRQASIKGGVVKTNPWLGRLRKRHNVKYV